MRLHPKIVLLLPLFGISMALEFGRLLSGHTWNGFTLLASNVSSVLLLALWTAACAFVLARRTLGLTLAIAGISASLMQGLLVVSAGSKLGLLHLGASVVGVLVLKRATALSRTPERPRLTSGADERRGIMAHAEATAW